MRITLKQPTPWPLNQLLAVCIVLLVLTLLASLSATITMVRGSLALPFPVSKQFRAITCDLPEDVVSTPPAVHYLFSERYGWFDTSHFFTGNPAKIIQDVEDATLHGGGIITITQDVRDGITGYTARYQVARDISPAKISDVALGIYLDWSLRFEAWQDTPPHGLFGPFTSFSIEDLPSHYVGFFATARKLDPAYVLACYLGGVEATGQAPPRLVAPEALPGSTSTVDVPIQHLTNKTFTPMVWEQGRWRNVPWPRSMRMEAISSSSGLWRFESAESWYFDQQLSQLLH